METTIFRREDEQSKSVCSILMIRVDDVNKVLLEASNYPKLIVRPPFNLHDHSMRHTVLASPYM
jgi:hypothetical protein